MAVEQARSLLQGSSPVGSTVSAPANSMTGASASLQQRHGQQMAAAGSGMAMYQSSHSGSDAIPTTKNSGVPQFSIFTEQVGQEGQSRPLSSGGAVPPEHRQTTPCETTASPPAESATRGKGTVPFQELRDATIAELALTHVLAASTLMDSQPWDFSTEGVVRVSVPTSFGLSQLQKEQLMLTQLVSSLAGQHLKFEPVLVQHESTTKVEVVSPQVEILCKLFKGNVVGVKKNESI